MKVTSSIEVTFNSNDYPNYDLADMGLMDDNGNLLKDKIIEYVEDSLAEIIEAGVRENHLSFDTRIWHE